LIFQEVNAHLSLETLEFKQTQARNCVCSLTIGDEHKEEQDRKSGRKKKKKPEKRRSWVFSLFLFLFLFSLSLTLPSPTFVVAASTIRALALASSPPEARKASSAACSSSRSEEERASRASEGEARGGRIRDWIDLLALLAPKAPTKARALGAGVAARGREHLREAPLGAVGAGERATRAAREGAIKLILF